MRDVLISIKRTPFQSLASFLVLSFVLFLVSLLFITLSFFHGLLAYVETRPQITVYFQTNAKESDIFKARDDLVNSGKVSSVKYISQKDAFKIYQEMNKDNPLLLEMVSADVLPPSLEVYVKKPEYLAQVAEFFKKNPAVDEVQYQKNVVDRLIRLTSVLRKISMIVVVYLVLMSIFVLVTIFYFKILQKKEEIEILQLLGADRNYILRPFLKEAFFFGFFSSIIIFLFLLIIFFYCYPFINNYLRGITQLNLVLFSYEISLWPINYLFLIITFALTTLFGILITTFSAFIAVNRYLKK